MTDRKVALITGASAGIGEASARALVKEGYFVGLLARREERLRALQQELGKANAMVLACDVTESSAVAAAVGRLAEAAGRIDLLVNNAGVMWVGKFLDLPPASDEQQVGANLLGVIYVLRAVLPVMERQGGGLVINVSSMLGRFAWENAAVYVATKHAVTGMTDSLRRQYAPEGKIRFVCLQPGIAETELHDAQGIAFGDYQQACKIQTPLTAQDVADAVLYIARQPAHVTISELTLRPATQVR